MKTYPVSLSKLGAYMRYRAEREGVAWDLPLHYLNEHFERGARTFFGVTLDNDQLLDDEQQPEMFADWQQRVIN